MIFTVGSHLTFIQQWSCLTQSCAVCAGCTSVLMQLVGMTFTVVTLNLKVLCYCTVALKNVKYVG